MYPASYSPDDHSRSRRPPPLDSISNRQTCQRLHHPVPAVNFPDEEPYGSLPCDGPHVLHNDQTRITSDAKMLNLKRRASRFGLGLFGKTKASDLDGKHEKVGMRLDTDEAANGPVTSIEYTPQQRQAPGRERPYVIPSVETEPTIDSRQGFTKQSLKGRSSFRKEINIKTWDPPPLFQAYPQAVKHATLRAPSLSAETIIRLHTNRKDEAKPKLESSNSEPHPGKDLKGKRSKRNAPGDTLSKGNWTHKVFVLVTTGYFLQYAGQGSFDRLPEKIMPLSKESVAFASDVIPGEPYVLQISQVSDDQGTLDKDASKTMLKKLGLRNETRRSTSTFLLVLEDPDEMSAWLVGVRKEIQATGGKEYTPDEFRKHATEHATPQLQQKPSQRYMVKRDPNRFCDGPLAEERSSIEQSKTTKRLSWATQTSTESRSLSATTVSMNQVYLDRLRETPRESYASTAAMTATTSPASSPRLAPGKLPSEASNPPDFTSAYSSMHDNVSHAHANKRKSMHGISPHQSSSYTPQHRRTSSPAAPNFSVPTFSERFSTSPGSSSIPTKTIPLSSSVHQEGTSPYENNDGNAVEERKSAVGELQHLRKPSPSAKNDRLLTPPHSSGSNNSSSALEGEKPSGRRFSSFEHSRSVSPLQLARHTPPPHPPPTAALPPLPRAALPYRASLTTQPPAGIPPAPPASKLPARFSMQSPPATPTFTLPVCEPFSAATDFSLTGKYAPVSVGPGGVSSTPLAASTAISSQPLTDDAAMLRPVQAYHSTPEIVQTNSIKHRKSLGPIHTNQGSDHNADEDVVSSQTRVNEGLTPHLSKSPPRPTRKAPPPPSQQENQGRKSMARIGREPPPVGPPDTNARPKISVSSRADSYFSAPAPHPFIPPIRVSERKFRGSLDGPWNPSFGAPQRTFIDLNVG